VTGSRAGPLLSVKHNAPPPRPGAVVRRRLQERLEAASSTRLCIVVAPAGWGKTTLLAQWVDQQPASQRFRLGVFGRVG
jgi:LuxR family transcriptional regulator, maltose regulon positive regulatory protein